ncbi:beta-ketoacyl synthase N-terminal-like domain-containing protein, partial [Streptomyces sp. URMC 129]|uniref:beta-ketoacyl synthase N-terminal-like domain-containing protein n=1 Tax=Streptomyces sp. URMC 129 TaxID=3423407 RepID=UPI003F1B0D6B
MASNTDPIAIVGVGLRLPGGVDSLDLLWGALREGRDLVSDQVPADRFDTAAFVDPAVRRAGKSYTGSGGFLEQIDSFDADFFGIAPKEASRLDPQQRLLLECAVEALDDAGIAPADLAGGDTAVLMGVSSHDYANLQERRLRAFSPYTISGSAACNTANRISYVLDLRGPSAAVDTACSSALTAVHQACEALRSGRSGLALAGGANVLLNPAGFIGFSAATMLSPTGRCHPFAAGADGFVRAEGAGVLVLKPLPAALADGDRVHAVILGTAVNADGRTQGLALPSPEAQADLLRRVYGAVGVHPDDVAYIEAHGTGTEAGDPVECDALGRVLGRARTGEPLPLGSVKSAVGHLEAAAGLAGLLSALLVLRERWIPAPPRTEPTSPAIDFAGLGLAPVTAGRPLPGGRLPVVGVNSFGFGGANAHVVLRAAPGAAGAGDGERAAPAAGAVPPRLPVLVSARTPQALTEAAARWAERLDGTDPAGFYDVAWTACRRRGRHEQRAVVLAAGPAGAATALRALAAGETPPGAARAAAVERGRVGFVFSGNGAQWLGMGAELLGADPAFRTEIAALDGELAPLLGWSVLEELAAPADPARVSRVEVAQPLLFAVQAGLVAALAARGVRPAAVTGHSVGEVAAAYCAGALGRADACRVITERSRAQAATAGLGRMAAVGLGVLEAERLLADPGLAGRLVVAGINSDRDVTVAGEAGALAALGTELTGRGVFFRDLGLDHAFHSPGMDGLREPLKAALAGLTPEDGRVPLISTVTGGRVAGSALGADHWWRNVREPVLFSAAVQALTGPGAGCDVLVEIGPHPVLRTYLRRVVAACGHPVAVIDTLSRTAAGPDALDAAHAHLLAAGAETDWSAFFPRRGRVVDLPAYPWQRERHWNGAPEWWLEGSAEHRPAGPTHPLLGPRLATAGPLWQQEVEPGPLAWLADHRVGAATVLPGAAYVDMALAAGHEVFEGAAEVTGLAVTRALTLPFDDPAARVRLQTAVAEDGALSISSHRGGNGTWTEHARGRVRRLLRDAPPAVDVPALRARLTGESGVREHYEALARAGLPHGPAFQPLTGLRVGDGEVLATYAATLDPARGHLAHPSVVDGALQAGLPLLAAAVRDPVPFLPARIETVRRWGPLPETGLVHVKAHAFTGHEACWDVRILAADGTVALELLGCRLRRFDAGRRPEPAVLTEALRAAPLPGTPAGRSPLPPPAEVLAACSGRLGAATERWRAHPYAATRARALELAAHFTAAAVRELLPHGDVHGGDPGPDFGLEDLFAAGADPKHGALLRTLFRTAVAQGVFATAGPGRWRLAVRPEPSRLFAATARDFPGDCVAMHGYGVCGRSLAGVLRGRTDPLSLLFSETDDLASRFYDATAVTHYHNRLAAHLLGAAVADWPRDRPLRVLEVGAGTGGLTAALLPHLPPERAHYTYTDVSPAFFTAARERFAAYDFLDFRVLDLDADPAGQGFAPGSFDLVIASNALHTARDLTAAVRHVAGLLAEGGHLLALESHTVGLMAPVFGLLDSFWSATDTGLRPDGPLLPRDEWPALLRRCGFTGTVQTGDTAGPARADYSVILAARGPRPPLPAGAPAAGSGAHPARAGDDGPPRTWLVCATSGLLAGVLKATRDALRARRPRDTVCEVPAADDPARWTELLAGTAGPADIVLAPPPGAPGDPAEQTTEEAVRQLAVLGALAAACERLPEERVPALWLVTDAGRGAPGGPPPGPGAGAAAWGAVRSLANEDPRLAARRIALAGLDGPAAATALAARLTGELAERPDDDEVLLTPAGRFVTRVGPLTP